MPIRWHGKKSRRGRISASLSSWTASVAGTFNVAQTYSGRIQALILDWTGVAAGIVQASAARTGTVVASLANWMSGISGWTNASPQWGTVPTQSATQGTTYQASLAGYASDPDGDPLTFGRTGSASDTAPSSITVNSAGLLTVPSTVTAGTYTVEAYADDGQDSAANDWALRTSGTSVVWFHNFDSAAEVNQFRWTGQYGGGNDPLARGVDATLCAHVATGGADGGGFLRVSYPLGRESNSSYWWRPFNPLTGATNGRGQNDPGANGTITPVAWPASDGSNTTNQWTSLVANPGYYMSATDQAANPGKFQGNDFWIQVRIRRAQLPGPPPNNAQYSNIVGKSIWPNVTTSTSTANEIVTYGEAYSESSLSQQPRHRMYEGRNRSGGPGIGGTSETDTIDNSDQPTDWRYSGGWDVLLYHVTPGTNGGTGTNRTRLEVWAAHPGDVAYTKIWDVLYSAAFDTGVNSVNAPNFPGWNAVLLACYHNGAVFTTTAFDFDYDQIIFSKDTIPLPNDPTQRGV